MLSEETVISQISVDEAGNVSVRRSTRILRDGEVIAETFHRHVIDPLEPLDGEADEVTAIARIVRTPERVAAATARREERRRGRPSP